MGRSTSVLNPPHMHGLIAASQGNVMRVRSMGLAAIAMLAMLCVAPASAICIGTAPEFPGSSPDYYAVKNEFARAEFVAKVRVFSEIWLGEDGKPKGLKPPFQSGGARPWGFDPYLGAWYGVRVEQVLKGAPPEGFSLFSENTSSRFWFRSGDSYLVFVERSEFEKPIGQAWTIDTCGNSRDWAKAGPLVKEIEPLAAPR
jgi:hypothetical protein